MAAIDFPEQIALDVSIDTLLADKARQAVDHYIQDQNPERGSDPKRWPITHNQIKGLRQVACHQPQHLTQFVDKQLAKAQAKADEGSKDPSPKQQAVLAFWTLLKELVQAREPKPWSLAYMRAQAMPQHLRPVDSPKGAKPTDAVKQAAAKQKQERQRWEEAWNAVHIPPYFRSFCIHYLYRMYNG